MIRLHSVTNISLLLVVSSSLTRCHDARIGRVQCDTLDVVVVALVEALSFGSRIVNHSQCSLVVEQLVCGSVTFKDLSAQLRKHVVYCTWFKNICSKT